VTSEPLAEFADVLDTLVDESWRRKSSFETRAFAALTANLALSTLYLSVSDKLNLVAELQQGWPGTLALTALIASVASVVLAVASAFPSNYPSPNPKTLKTDFQTICDGEADARDVLIARIEARLQQYESAQNASRRRGVAVLAAFVTLGLATSALVASFLIALGTTSSH
jgi:hypothetical protein